MKNTIIVVSSNRDIEQDTQLMLRKLGNLGAVVLLQRGSPDVAFARNKVLTWAVDMLEKTPERDMVLMLDDDMFAPEETIQEVVDRARRLQEPCSAVYTTAKATLAGARMEAKPGYWFTGLGCFAIPRALLLELDARMPKFTHYDDEVYTAFTSTGEEGGIWYAEDFRLCLNLGGARLLPIPVAHIKKWHLWPDKAALEKLAEEAKQHEQA